MSRSVQLSSMLKKYLPLLLLIYAGSESASGTSNTMLSFASSAKRRVDSLENEASSKARSRMRAADGAEMRSVCRSWSEV